MFNEALNWGSISIAIRNLLHWITENDKEIYSMSLKNDSIVIKVSAPEYVNQALVAIAGIQAVQPEATTSDTIIVKQRIE